MTRPSSDDLSPVSAMAMGNCLGCFSNGFDLESQIGMDFKHRTSNYLLYHVVEDDLFYLSKIKCSSFRNWLFSIVS